MKAMLATAAVRRRVSRKIERHLDAVDKLLALLDALDGDSDAEPSLGAPNPTFPSLEALPATWALSQGLTQAGWGDGTRDDREGEHDGREIDCEGGAASAFHGS
jgi:hypothetical protein